MTTVLADEPMVSRSCNDGEHRLCVNGPGREFGRCVCACHLLFGLNDALGE